MHPSGIYTVSLLLLVLAVSLLQKRMLPPIILLGGLVSIVLFVRWLVSWSKVFLAPGCTLSCMDEALCFHGDFILCAYNTAVMMMTHKLRIITVVLVLPYMYVNTSLIFWNVITHTMCVKLLLLKCLKSFAEDILQQSFRHACLKCIDSVFSCYTCKHALCLSLTSSIKDFPWWNH